MQIKINDCTIRDGGHINQWHFDDLLVKSSYFAASNAQVDYFEIGYKNDKNKKGLGPYGYCQESYIFSQFKSFTNCKLLCMIDADKYTGYYIPVCHKSKTPFSGIRVAAYPSGASIAVKLIENLHAKGYEVFLQIMASSEWTSEHLAILKKWKRKNILQAAYFADSFGSYVPRDITDYIKKLKSLGFEKIGFHSHNNLQMAFANTLQAIEDGASFIDASIYGMGRGAGNLPIEILLSYLYKEKYSRYNVVPYLDVIGRFFIKLQQEYKWGYSLKTLLGGGWNLHPYYIDALFKTDMYTVEEIWNALAWIKKKCPISFSEKELEQTLQQRFYTPSRQHATKVIEEIDKQVKIFSVSDAFKLTNLKLADRHKNRKFLIIANGLSIKKYADKIKKLIRDNRLITIGCNNLYGLYKPMYHIFVSKKRFLKIAPTIDKKSILIIPTFFGKRLVEENYGGKYEHIEVISTEDIISPPIKGIIQQNFYLNVSVSAILTAFQMGAAEILAVGMDGYESENVGKPIRFYNEDGLPDDKEVASLKYENLAIELRRVSEFLQKQGVPFIIITPTSHRRYYENLFGIKAH